MNLDQEHLGIPDDCSRRQLARSRGNVKGAYFKFNAIFLASSLRSYDTCPKVYQNKNKCMKMLKNVLEKHVYTCFDNLRYSICIEKYISTNSWCKRFVNVLKNKQHFLCFYIFTLIVTI